jgi:ketosteroid isomerase-like protein
MKEKDLDRWVAKYRKAWESNDPADIAALWTEDAALYRRPDEEPVLGRDAIVTAWLEVADAPARRRSSTRCWGSVTGSGSFAAGRRT